MNTGLIGSENIDKYSIAHKIWQYIFSHYSPDSTFTYYSISQKSEVNEILEKVRVGEIRGVNVALPWKALAAECCDMKTPVVDSTGFANTIYAEGGKLIADNTDGVGLIAGLKELPKNTLIYGAGGAGVVLAYELVNRGVSVTVTDINLDKLTQLKQKSKNWLMSDLVTIQESNSTFTGLFEMVVNATPLGRKNLSADLTSENYFDQSPLQQNEIENFNKNSLFVEMNYHPFKTKFLNDAESMKMDIQVGVVMLFHQAAMTFELYSGKKVMPPNDFTKFYSDILNLSS